MNPWKLISSCEDSRGEKMTVCVHQEGCAWVTGKQLPMEDDTDAGRVEMGLFSMEQLESCWTSVATRAFTTMR